MRRPDIATAPSTDDPALDAMFEDMLAAAEEGRDVGVDSLGVRAASSAGPAALLAALARSVARGARALPRFDDFDVFDSLGHGGMGAVYLARQLSLGARVVAIKVLAHGSALSPASRQRFRREAEALAALRHPGIVGVHGVVSSGDLLGYTMDFIDGVSMLELIDALRAAPTGLAPAAAMDSVRATLSAVPVGDGSYPRYIARIGVQVCSALEAVHAARLLHRDIKPSNIMLRRDGSPVLTDFGLVRDEDATLLTREGGFVGTAAYAPPEQLVGDHHALTPASDIYSLGATLHHALGLRAPFEGASPVAVLRQINDRGPAPLPDHEARAPRDLVSIILKAMDPEPARRYPGAGALREDLERFLADRPVKARRIGPVGRTRRFLKRNRRAVAWAVLSAAVVAVVAGAAYATQILAPRWANEAIVRAQTNLLRPESNSTLFNYAIWGVRVRETIEGDAASLADSLDAYDHAARLGADAPGASLEREVVRLVHAYARGAPPEPGAPETAATKYLEAWAAAQAQSVGAELTPLVDVDALAPDDLRRVGLAAFLVHDSVTAVRAWERLDALEELDNLAGAGLGLVMLLEDRPALAYPRLQRAMDAYPGAGFLAQYTAEAALRCADLGVARRCLATAATMPRADPLAQFRIGLLIDLAAGDATALDRYHASIKTPEWTTVLSYQVGQMLLTLDRVEESLPILALAAQELAPGVRPRQTFAAAVERWWSAQDDGERLGFCRRLAARPPASPPVDWEEWAIASVFTPEQLPLLGPAEDEGARAELVAIAERFIHPVDLRASGNWSVWADHLDPATRTMLARWLLTGEGDPPPRFNSLAQTLSPSSEKRAHSRSPFPFLRGGGKFLFAGPPLIWSSHASALVRHGRTGPALWFDLEGAWSMNRLTLTASAIAAGLASGQASHGGTPGCAQAGLVVNEVKISETSGGFGGQLDGGDYFGRGSAGIGDLDGDGVEDMVVTTPYDDDGGTNRGAVWIIFLNSDGTVKSEQKISDTAGGFDGVLTDSDLFGRSACGIGDFDGDDVPDIAVGTFDDDGGTGRGSVWILFLNANGTVKDEREISDTQGGFDGVLDNDDAFGAAVDSIGDLDGDGVIDLVVGAETDDDGGADRGAIWIVFLNANGTVKAEQKISDTEGGFDGVLTNTDIFGTACTALGDLDGDDVVDLAVGAFLDSDDGFQRGAVWILFLNDDGTVKAEQKISDSQGGFNGALQDFDRLGNAVENVGDLDADGVTDLAVGSYIDSDDGTQRGSVWIMFLNPNGTVKAETKISDSLGGFDGVLDNFDYFGNALGLLGDLDGDGVRELAVSAPGDADGGATDTGAVWIVSIDDCINDLTVLAHPDSVLLPPGGGALSFTVTAIGDAPITYQWRKDSVPLANGSGISGATTNTLSFMPAANDDIGAYDCVITNPTGSVFTNAAILAVRQTCNGDFDGDFDIDFGDLNFILSGFNSSCPTP